MLDFAARALPRAYAPVRVRDGTAVVLAIGDDAGGAWSITAAGGAWELRRGAAANPAATVRMNADSAWRMFFNALSPSAAAARAIVEGDAALASPLFTARAVMV